MDSTLGAAPGNLGARERAGEEGGLGDHLRTSPGRVTLPPHPWHISLKTENEGRILSEGAGSVTGSTGSNGRVLGYSYPKHGALSRVSRDDPPPWPELRIKAPPCSPIPESGVGVVPHA